MPVDTTPVLSGTRPQPQVHLSAALDEVIIDGAPNGATVTAFADACLAAAVDETGEATEDWTVMHEGATRAVGAQQRIKFMRASRDVSVLTLVWS